MLWRRALVLVVVGFVHAMLLYVGDILAAYGVLLLVGAWVVWWRDRWLWVWPVAVLRADLVAVDGLDVDQRRRPGPLDAARRPGAMFAERIVVQPFIMLLGPIGFACPFLVGLWAGRRRLLEQPARAPPVARAVAVVGIAVAVLGAQPVALMLAGVIASRRRTCSS